MTAPTVAYDIIANDKTGAVLAGIREHLKGLGAATQTVGRQGAREFEGFRGIMVSLGASTEGSAKGARLLEGAVAAVASRAVGLQGPFGKIAESVLLFSGGSVALLGIAAAVAAVGMAWKRANEEAEAHSATIAKLLEKYKQLPTAAGDVVQLNRQAGDLAAQFGAKQSALRAAQAAVRGDTGNLSDDPNDIRRHAQLVATRDRIQGELDAIALELRLTRSALARANIAASATGPKGERDGTKEAELKLDPSLTKIKLDSYFQGASRAYLEALEKEGAGAKAAARAHEEAAERIVQTAITMANAIAGVMEQLLRGDSFGSILEGIGGVVSLIPGGQLIGAGIAIGGGLINAASGSDKPTPVSIENVSSMAQGQLRQSIGPQRVVLVVTDDRGNITERRTLMQQLQNESNRDGIVRLPVSGRR